MSDFQFFNPVFNNGNADVTNITQTIYSNVLTPAIYANVGLNSFVLSGTVDVNTPSASVSDSATRVTSSGGSILFGKSSATGFFFGLVVQFTTSTTLPTGISALTDYYVTPISSTTYKVSTSYANALAGTYVAYTDTGTGNQTATPVAIAGASLFLQGSNDYDKGGSTWVTVPLSSTTITADATIGPLSFPNVEFANYRCAAAITTGSMAFSNLQIGYKGAE